MKNRKPLFIGAAIVILAALVFVLLRPDAPETRSARSARPADTHDMPGMDMSGMSTDGTVQLTPDQIRQFGITFDSVAERELQGSVRAAGSIAYDETTLATVAARFDGFIERLYVNITGQQVRLGQPLADIYSPELLAAQEELLLAVRLGSTSDRTLVPGNAPPSDLVAAARQRLRLLGVSNAQIDEVLASGRARRALTIYSPANGVVVEKMAIQGAGVDTGDPLFQIADISRVWVEAELREADAAQIGTGAPATVEVSALPGRRLQGRVDYIYPSLASETRTLKARIRLANPEGRLRPGMYAAVLLSAPSRTALTIPASALIRTGERQVVFVAEGASQLRPQEVEIGRESGGLVEVLAGLQRGQRVVTSAQFLLDSESNLATVMKSMIGQMSTSDLRTNR